jgi:hypothetical protein
LKKLTARFWLLQNRSAFLIPTMFLLVDPIGFESYRFGTPLVSHFAEAGLLRYAQGLRILRRKQINLLPLAIYSVFAKQPYVHDTNLGGPYRIRTDDLLIANEALYQLS